MRFPPTANFWQQAVVTSHSASSILPLRQRSTLCSVTSLYVRVVSSSSCVLINTRKVLDVAWSPDGTRLVALTMGFSGERKGFYGIIIEVTNNNAHSTVYKTNKGVRIASCLQLFRCSSVVQLLGCAFSPSGILAVGRMDHAVTLLVPSQNYRILGRLIGLAHWVR